MQRIVCFLLIAMVIMTVKSQVTFQKVYDVPGSNGEAFYCTRQARDGGYIMTGLMNDIGLLVKTDCMGNIEWKFGFDFGYPSVYSEIARQTADGGFIACGSTYLPGNGDGQIFLIKTDPAGNIQWSKVYGGNFDDSGHYLEQTSDGSFIIGGMLTISTIPTGPVAYAALIKTDSTGNVQWSKIYDICPTNDNPIMSVKTCKDGGYIFITGACAAGETAIVKTDSSGSLQWSKKFNTLQWSRDVCQTADEGYIIIGATNYGAGNTDCFLLKLDNAGNQQWAKAYGGPGQDLGYAVIQLNDGGYIVMSEEYSYGFGLNDNYLMRTDASGNIVWTYSYGGPAGEDNDTDNLSLTKDGGYAFGGFTFSFGDSSLKPVLVKTDSSGNSGCNQQPINFAAAPISFLMDTFSVTVSIAWVTVEDTINKTNINVTTLDLCSSCIPPAAGISGADSLCKGDSVSLSATAIGDYLWSTGDTTGTITVSPDTNSVYSLIISNCICSDTDSFVVNVFTPATLSLSGDTSICNGYSATLVVSGANNYLWNTGDTDSSITVSPSATTTYSVQGNNSLCTEPDSITVTVLPSPVANAGPDQSICAGFSTTLNASGGSTYSWLPAAGISDTSIPDPEVNPILTTQYILIASMGSCSDSDTVAIIVFPLPAASAGADTTVFSGDTAALFATGGISYHWSTGDTTAFITVNPEETTEYSVTVTDGNGCKFYDTVRVSVDFKCGDVFVANALSPNGDGINDKIFVRGKCIKEFEFAIFDRWGEKVFETKDKSIGWDGTFNGEPLNTAVFVYYLKAILTDNTEFNSSGNITLFR